MANIGWQSDQINNGNWIHSLGSQEYVLSTYHNQMEWDDLPRHITKSKHSSSLNAKHLQSHEAMHLDKDFHDEFQEMDRDADVSKEAPPVAAGGDSAANEATSIHTLQPGKELEHHMLHDFGIQLKNIPLDAELHSSFFDFE
ncbi:hypothetical protein RFI_11621, partial [Reticulomyxa filosa]